MRHNRIVSILHRIVLAQELIPLLAHRLPIRSNYPVEDDREGLHRVALAPEAKAVLLRYPSHIRVRVRGAQHRHPVLQVRQQPRREVRDREPMIQEYQSHVARAHQLVILRLRHPLHHRHVKVKVIVKVIVPSLQPGQFRPRADHHEVAVRTFRVRLQALHQERNPLRLPQVPPIDKDRLVGRQPVLLPHRIPICAICVICVT